MSDREKKIAEIREALEKATPGPWEAVDIGMPSGAVWRVDAKYMIATAMKKENADIVANAPEWLRFLLELFDEAKKDAEFWKNEYEKGVKRVAFLGDSFERLRQERDKLIECLRFYERLARGREINDGGRRARTLLAEIGAAVMQHEPR